MTHSTVLPYGYLQTAVKEVLEDERERIKALPCMQMEEVGEDWGHTFNQGKVTGRNALRKQIIESL